MRFRLTAATGGKAKFFKTVINRSYARKMCILRNWYAIKSKGYTIEKAEKRVIEIFGVEKDVFYSKGRRRIQVAARNLLCYWAVRELGLTATELAKRLRMAQPAVSYALIRGDLIAKEKELHFS